MGELGVELSDPDTPSLDVLNEILNSFGGVLFNEIRSKEVSTVCLPVSVAHLIVCSLQRESLHVIYSLL